MKADWTINSHYITHTYSSGMVGRICIMSSGVKASFVCHAFVQQRLLYCVNMYRSVVLTWDSLISRCFWRWWHFVKATTCTVMYYAQQNISCRKYWGKSFNYSRLFCYIILFNCSYISLVHACSTSTIIIKIQLLLLTLALLTAHTTNSPNHSRRKCMSNVVRIDSSTSFHLSKLSNAKFSLLYDVYMVRDWRRKLRLIALWSERVK